MSVFRSLTTSRANFIVFFAVIIFFIGFVSLYFYFPRGGEGDNGSGRQASESSNSNSATIQPNILTSLDSGDLVGTFTISERGTLGDMLIDVHAIVEGSYKTLQVDSDENRLDKDYLGINIEIFNLSHTERDELFIGLEDDLGNEYNLDPSLAFYLGSVKEFNWDKYVYPRSISEGYLLFPPPHKDAKKVKLTFFSDVRGDKIIFELDRPGGELDSPGVE